LAQFVNTGFSWGLFGSSDSRHLIASAFRGAAEILAAMLLVNATPALAIQYGGGGGHAGGGGGGVHFSGGGGGHVAGGSSHPSAGGQRASAPHPSGPAPRPSGAPGSSAGSRVVSRVPQTTHVAEPGYVWEATPGYANRTGPETPKDLGKRGYVWEEGPSSGVAGEKNSYFLTANLLPSNDAAARGAAGAGGTFVARGSVSPHSNAVIVNRRPIPSASIGARPARIIRTGRPGFFGGFYPFGFFPGFFFNDCFGAGFDYGYGYGFGFGYNPCGYGYLYPGYGHYQGGGYSDFTGDVTNDMSPQSYGPSSAAPDSEPSADKDEATAPASAAAPTPGADSTVLFLKDGTSYGVTDYWLEGGRLHYVTTYGGANAIELDALDMQRTVDENAKHGLMFALRPPHWQDQEVQPHP
jgi:hypothetical protein